MTHVFSGTENNYSVTDRFARRSTQWCANGAAKRPDERVQHTLRGGDGSTELARRLEQTAER
jgi:hypothetical protein